MAHAPPKWTAAELREQRDEAEHLFIQARKREGPEAYQRFYAEAEAEARLLFEETGDLRGLTGAVFEEHKELLDAARNVAGPPISADDLRTMVGDPLGRSRLDPAVAQAVADAVRPVIDPIRFPWLAEDRQPTSAERDIALRWTAGLLAVQRQGTARRNRASKGQEAAVARALSAVGFLERPRSEVGAIEVMDSLDRGQFTREVKVAGSKCDVPVRLTDGRFLPLECKVSNSAVNSWKRLVREAGGKASTWTRHFGGGQCIPAAVLAGVFDLSLLKSAQNDHGLTIFWQHRLEQLQEFVGQAA